MKILVTGGAGFIGSNITEGLINLGHEVVIIDDLSMGRIENVPNAAEFIEIDIRSKDLSRLFNDVKFDAICHHAARSDLRASVENPIEDLSINVEGSLNLLELSKKYKVKKFIYASSGGAIYGEQKEYPVGENHDTNPESPYGVGKLAVEKYMQIYSNQYGIDATALRYANVYGPKQNPFGEAGVIAIFTERLLAKKQVFINGDGLQTRDYTYVVDVVKANVAALTISGFNVLNIGTAIETDVLTLFDTLCRLTGTNTKRIHKPEPPGEQRRSVIDPAKAEDIIDWKPTVKLEEGLLLTVDYFKKKMN